MKENDFISYPSRFNINNNDTENNPNKQKYDIVMKSQKRYRNKVVRRTPIFYRAIPKDKEVNSIEDIANLEEIKYMINENHKKDDIEFEETQDPRCLKSKMVMLVNREDEYYDFSVKFISDVLNYDHGIYKVVSYRFKLFGKYYRNVLDWGFSDICQLAYDFPSFGDSDLEDRKCSEAYTIVREDSIKYTIRKKIKEEQKESGIIIFQFVYAPVKLEKVEETTQAKIGINTSIPFLNNFIPVTDNMKGYKHSIIKEDPFPDLPMTEYYIVPFKVYYLN